MPKYYVIPIMESHLFIPYRKGESIPISQYVEIYYPKLAKLEKERVDILYSETYDAPLTGKQKEQLKQNALQKKQVAEELGIPLCILAMKEGETTCEVATHSQILSHNQDFLDFREQPRTIFLTYYNGDYIKKVNKFMKRKDFVVLNGGSKKMLKKQ